MVGLFPDCLTEVEAIYAPSEAYAFHETDHDKYRINLPPTKPVGRTTGMFVMIVVPAFADAPEGDKPVIAALVPRLKIAVSPAVC